MNKDVSFGSYYPVSSPVHKMNACVKLVIFIALVVLIFLIKNFYGFIAYGAFLIFIIILSRVPILSVLKSLKAIIFLIVFTVLLNLLFSDKSGKVLFKIWKLKITLENVLFSSFMALRLVTLAMTSSMLTFTSTPIELTDAIEILLKPLTWIKFPVHTLALIMSIALRFIPTLTEKTEQIINAQKARGSFIDNGNFIKKIKALVPVIIPLLIASFTIADQLGDAMDARCYNGSKKRTKYKKSVIRLKDVVGFLLTVALFVGVIIINIKLGRSV